MGQTVTDVGLEKKANGHELKKHAATIHCSNALSLLQRKISNALLYHAYPELMTHAEHEISIKQLCKLIAYHGNNHSAIKEALKGLLSTVIEWNLVNDVTGSEDWTASSILASVSLQGPLCYFAYSPRMKQLLHSPSMFGKINLFIQSRFKSSYGLALYENCIRYRGLAHTKWFEMDLFRKLMGVPADKYTIFRDFKRRVLDKSVEEVNMFSDLFVEPELLREGRQITKIRFSLKERSKKVRIGTQPATNEDSTEENQAETVCELKTKLIADYGLSDERAEKILQEYGKDRVQEKIFLIESSKNFQRGKVQNRTGYFISALKEDYQPVTAPTMQAKPKSQQSVKQKEQKSREEQIRKAYTHYRESAIDVFIESLSDAIKQPFFNKFYQYAADSIAIVLRLQRKRYAQDNVLSSPQVKAQLRQFACQEFPELQSQLLTLEQFIQQQLFTNE